MDTSPSPFPSPMVSDSTHTNQPSSSSDIFSALLQPYSSTTSPFVPASTLTPFPQCFHTLIPSSRPTTRDINKATHAKRVTPAVTLHIHSSTKLGSCTSTLGSVFTLQHEHRRNDMTPRMSHRSHDSSEDPSVHLGHTRKRNTWW